MAYARQAESDLRVYDQLRRLDRQISRCHRLHYLQMAAEKACKARLYSIQKGPLNHNFSHQVVEKVLSVWMSRFPETYSGSVRAQVRKHAREIDRLAPAVDREVRPDNTEYPWETKLAEVIAPCDYGFPALDDIHSAFVVTLKIIRQTANDITSNFATKT